MIVSLSKAHEVDPNITAHDLDAYETQVRELTNNRFHHKHIKMTNIALVGDKIVSPKELVGFRVGDTVEVFGSRFNDGLYIVSSITPFELVVDADFISEVSISGGVVQVVYPADVKAGLLDVIRYKQETAGRAGIKSESIARMSRTYESVNEVGNVDGIPGSQWAFLNKYKKIRW